MNAPLALYIHVPFCSQRCSYCHFAIRVLHPSSDVSLHHRRYLEALDQELTTLAARYGQRPLTSIFLGGGTPSQLGAAALGQLLHSVQDKFSLAADCEISLEVNPEDVTPGFLPQLLAAGYNRLSMGVQTFHDASLKAIGRPHNGATALAVLEQAAIFPRGISLDLILGLPHQTMQTLETDLDHVCRIAPQHVSLYMLERDLPTPLDKIAKNLPMPDEDRQADFYERVCSRLAEGGFEHYEISNFAKPGYRCRHNLAYWRCEDYLAAGPAAVGRVGNLLSSNHEKLSLWLQAVSASGSGVASQETWSEMRLMQERLVQGMRLHEGVPEAWLSDSQREHLKLCHSEGLLEQVGDRLCLSGRGRLLGNEVFAVFVEDEA